MRGAAAVAAIALTLSAAYAEQEAKRAVRPENYRPTRSPLTPAIFAGDTLYLSGTTGGDPATGELVKGGLEPEMRRVFSNVQLVLKTAGMELSDVVAVTTYLADMADFARYNEIYREYFKTEPLPTRSTVAVKELARGARIEMTLTAFRPGAGRQASPAAASPARNPEENPPPNVTRLTGFGERAAWSPDDKRVAFMGKSFGDAFEIDLGTRMTRLLTGHFQHPGFLRVHYLPNGDFFLIGARTFTDIRTTRSRDQEMWVMKSDLGAPPAALSHKISEGVAISRKRMKIAWSNTRGQYPDLFGEGESVIYTADVVYKDGVPELANKKEVLRARAPECTLEAQDFRNDDTELIYTCYRSPYADVLGVDLATGKVSTYRKLPDEYNEVEGISPDGKWTLVESSREQGGPDRQNSRYIDIWKLRLEPNSSDFVRLTRWGDYEGFKASNPVVSSDGRRIAFQSARNNEPAGVGHGIFVLTLP